ncbi:MAG: M15 family metallopeptidase [Deltaproteobacteria bacterium]|nr:M15 family metallopeptidase [Deltaproteobacteria bacterium]
MPVRDIRLLDPEVQKKAESLLKALKAKGLDGIITETYRSRATHNAYYAQGRAPLAAVNGLREGVGLWPITFKQNRIITWLKDTLHFYDVAFDFALVSKGRAVWSTKADINDNDIPDYIEAGKIAKECGLEWGGDWKKRDMVHCQYTGGLTKKQLEEGMRPSDLITRDT